MLHVNSQGDHSSDNVISDNSLTVRGTPAHVKCYHASTSAIVSDK